jgi:hypothetical protein
MRPRTTSPKAGATTGANAYGKAYAKAAIGAVALLLAAPDGAFAAAATKPAGGAAITEVALATAGASLLTAALFWLGWAHRAGRTSILRRPAEATARATGLPVWAALPTQIASASLLVALFGMYWDISLHIDVGRDPGPLANPAHYFILAGLFGLFTAGFLALVLPEGKPSRAAVRISGDWYAPIGGVALVACAAFSLSGFPLDDVWHRLFGQDVTLWGPTHMMLIGGAALALIGHTMLMVEGRTGAPSGAHARGFLGLLAKTRYAAVMGGLLVGLSAFQAEFDFGVPQYRLLFHPVLIAAAGAIALVAARTYAGRGAALGAAAYFIVIRGLITLLVGPVLGETTPHMPLYLAEAGLVEAVALVVPTTRSYSFGALCGLLIGTVGFAAEFGWAQLWAPNAWPTALIGESIVAVIVMAVAGGLVGAFLGSALGSARSSARVRLPRVAPAALGLAAIIAVMGYGLDTKPAAGIRASVALRDVTPAPNRTVEATVRIDPTSAARDADWLTAMAWQGGGLHNDPLRKVGPGVWRTTKPLPVHGNWKALVRLQRQRSIVAVPVYLPKDAAIPAAETPAPARFERSFVLEKHILQREQKSDVPASLATIAYTTIGSIVLALLVLLGWSLTRLGQKSAPDAPLRRRRAARRVVAPRSA